MILGIVFPQNIKIITLSKEVDIHTLIGNIGGYIGLFLGNFVSYYIIGSFELIHSVFHRNYDAYHQYFSGYTLVQLPDLLFLMYDYLKIEHLRLEPHLATNETQSCRSVSANTTISETVSQISNPTKDNVASDANLGAWNKSQPSLSIEKSVVLGKYNSPDSIQELQHMHTEMNGRIEELSKSVDEIKQQLSYVSLRQEII